MMLSLPALLLLLAAVSFGDDSMQSDIGESNVQKNSNKILIGPDGIARRMGPKETRKPTGKDMSSKCCDWAKEGQCTINSRYMFVYCPESCGTVGANELTWPRHTHKIPKKCRKIGVVASAATGAVINNDESFFEDSTMPSSRPADYDSTAAQKSIVRPGWFGSNSFGAFGGIPVTFGGFGNSLTRQIRTRLLENTNNNNNKPVETKAGGEGGGRSLGGYSQFYRRSIGDPFSGMFTNTDSINIDHFLRANAGHGSLANGWNAMQYPTMQQGLGAWNNPQARGGAWNIPQGVGFGAMGSNLGFGLAQGWAGNTAGLTVPATSAAAATEQDQTTSIQTAPAPAAFSGWAGNLWNRPATTGLYAQRPTSAGITSDFKAGTKFEWNGQSLVEIKDDAVVTTPENV